MTAKACGNGGMVEPLKHRRTKGAETDMLGLTPPRHTPTLPTPAVRSAQSAAVLESPCERVRSTQLRRPRSRSATSAIRVRREKAALSSGCEPHPANAPAGSNRSSHGGDEMAEAFGVAVTFR